MSLFQMGRGFGYPYGVAGLCAVFLFCFAGLIAATWFGEPTHGETAESFGGWVERYEAHSRRAAEALQLAQQTLAASENGEATAQVLQLLETSQSHQRSANEQMAPVVDWIARNFKEVSN
jgi:hypothetical protein